MLFQVDDVFHATTNPQTLCSESLVKTINEGHRHKDTHITFDHTTQKAVLNERDLNQPNAAPKHAENDIPPCVQDVVTAFYYLRRQKLKSATRLNCRLTMARRRSTWWSRCRRAKRCKPRWERLKLSASSRKFLTDCSSAKAEC